MQDRELYRRILGIEAPWEVERVELKLEKGEVHIYLDHAKDVTWLCPECSTPNPLHDHQPERCCARRAAKGRRLYRQIGQS